MIILDKHMTICKISLVSMAFVLFLLLSTASADTVEGTSPNITETRLTTSGLAHSPAIYGDRIVWDDYLNESRDIYMYDVSTKKKTKISTNESVPSNPAIYGDKIVWEDSRNSSFNPPTEIYMYDLSTSSESLIIAGDHPPYLMNPAIYDDKIVWNGCLDDYSDVFMYDLSTKKETKITTGSSTEPDIYGNRIVYSVYSNRNYDIYMYDLSTKKEKKITTDKSYQNQPAIHKDRIVWSDDRNSNDVEWTPDIYMHDLSTSKEIRITTSGSAENPAIYGDKIVWQDGRSGYRNYDIYMYDLSTKKETRITNSGSAENPRIYGNNIVWEDNRNENSDIYMAIVSSENPQPKPPVADFWGSPLSGKVPLKVKFTETSKGSPTSWKWDFGDGKSSTEKSPTHTYSAAGTYTVKLTAANEAGSNTKTKSNYIKVTGSSQVPVANFGGSPLSGKAPLKVQFTDKSSNSPTSWKWSFGDGTYSTTKNPAHTYSKAGKYTVSLIVKNAAGTNTKTIKDYITVKTAPVKPVAAFSAKPTSGNAPLKVTFTDKSANSPTSWKWTFGDGKTSTSRSPAYTYSKAGKYTVSLTVKNAAGSSTKTIKNYIVVNTLKTPVASFSAKPTSGKAPLNVQFTDKSSNSPTSWKWSFGDGTYSTAKNPVHKYSKIGKYTVSLTVKNAKGSNIKTISNYIIVKK